MRSLILQALIRLGLVICLIGTQIGAQRDQHDYTLPVLDYYRSDVPDDVIEWLAESLEKQPYNGLDMIEDVGNELMSKAPEETSDDPETDDKTLYDWSVELFENLSETVALAKSGPDMIEECHPNNYKYLLSSIKWINSLDSSNPIKPSERYSKFFNLVGELTQKIMSICTQNIESAHESYLHQGRSWWEEEMDEYFEIFVDSEEEKQTGSPEQADHVLFRKALKVDSFDNKFLTSLIEELYEDDEKDESIDDFNQQWVNDTRRQIHKICENLTDQLALFVGIYDIADGSNPELTRPLDKLADNWSFKKLREYSRLCNGLLIDNTANEQNN